MIIGFYKGTKSTLASNLIQERFINGEFAKNLKVFSKLPEQKIL